MVTALGCFGGDFNRDNGLLLSFSYKMSDILSDKFSGVAMQPRKTLTRGSCEGGSDPTNFFGRLKAEKVGVAPAQSGVFFCVTFLILVSFVSSFSRDICASQAEEDAEDEAEVGNSYLLQLLRPNSRREYRGKLLVVLERPTTHFGHEIVCKSGVAPAQHSVLPASKLVVAPCCATSCLLSTCSMSKVTTRVTHMVIFVFHAHFTFPRCQ